MNRPDLIRQLLSDTSGGELASINDVNASQNYVMNSRFDFAQRGTSFNSIPNPINTLDRWGFTFDGSTGTYNLSQNGLTIQDTIPGFPAFYLGLNQTVAPSGDSLRVLHQQIEGVRNLAGKRCTLTFWAAADTTRNIQVNLRQNFGSGGSSSVELPLQTVTLTSLLAKYTLHFTVPSITGQTVGPGDTLELRFWLPINTTFGFALTQVMLNEGNLPAPWSYMGKTFAGELTLCQRFYEKSIPYDLAPGSAAPGIIVTTWGGVNFATNDPFYTGSFKVVKRTAPSMIIYSTSGTANAIYNHYTGLQYTAIAGASTELYTLGISHATANNWEVYQFYFIADAEY